MRLSAATIVTRAMTVASRTNPIGSRTSNAQSLKDNVIPLSNCDPSAATRVARNSSMARHTSKAASKMVSQITGFAVQPNKAVVGANAFAHASGIHQDGMLKARETYEIMRAEDVGWAATKIVLGKLSGRNAFKARLQELGIALESEADVNAAFGRFKELADRKSDIFDEDIMALVSAEDHAHEGEHYRFVSLSQRSETGEMPTAKVVFSMGGVEFSCEGVGDGPVDATVNAIEKEVASGAELVLFSINAISGGTQSQGEVTMRLSRAGRIVNGVGADPDIVVASAKAYIAGLNKLHSTLERVKAQG